MPARSASPPAAVSDEPRPAKIRKRGYDPLTTMTWIPGGTFLMGSADFYPEERPVHRVSVDAFWMDRHPVTVAEFRRFVKATGHVTLAERAPDAAARWDRPEGPGSDTYTRARHPVVHVAPEDAEAYAAWAGKALPTEAEWERAARGGLDGATYAWGDEVTPDDRFMANFWQGEFPWQNFGRDGFMGTSPVGSYAPNGFGL